MQNMEYRNEIEYGNRIYRYVEWIWVVPDSYCSFCQEKPQYNIYKYQLTYGTNSPKIRKTNSIKLYSNIILKYITSIL
jgi:hypothetical protein